LKATVPLFLLSVLSQTSDCVHISEGLDWIGSVWFAVIMGILMAIEVIADMVPGVAHILHTVMIVVHPIFGAVVAIAPLIDSSWWVRVPTLVLGGVIALVLHIGRMLVRFLVSGATAGFCNPCVSLLESIIAFTVCPLAIFIPIAAILFGIFFLISFVVTSVVKAYRKYTGTNIEDDDLMAIVEEKQTEPKKWVDDNLVNHCHSCGNKFGVMTRKHHCRWCGNIYCDDCSKRKCEVPTLKGEQRVCDRCFGALTTSDSPSLPSLPSLFSGSESEKLEGGLEGKGTGEKDALLV